jgi:hypothetical protein
MSVPASSRKPSDASIDGVPDMFGARRVAP